MFEPPRRLEYTWDTDILRFEVIPTDEGCLLRFTTIIGEHAMSARAAAGWPLCIDALVGHVDGQARGPGEKSDWDPLFEQYSALIGGGMSPPPKAAYDALG